jgi:hypothetical protein
MLGLLTLGLGGFYLGWNCISWSVWWAQQEIWLVFCLLVFGGLVFLTLGWRAMYFAALVMLRLTTARLAWRDFRNSLADWLFTSKTGWSE